MKSSTKKAPEDFVHLHTFPGYAVARSGEVWSFKTKVWRKLKPRASSPKKYSKNLPYLYVALYVDKKRFERAIHLLVLEAFYGPRPNGYVGSHRNGKCQDNRAENLRWKTVSDNQRDRVVHGTHSRGERGRSAVVSNEVASQIRGEYGPLRGKGARSGKITIADLAKKYGLNQSTTYGIVSGRRYAS